MHILTKTSKAIALICALAGIMNASAQQRLQEDKEIKVGKLENGMTYYLRHNSNPKGCADFYIVHNVGALQEDDNQNGLAHFLEHMAFNGTKHYPDKKLLEFLSTEGVRFGYNVNAYTSRYETVYNLSNIPLVRESFVDSVMLILHDWSCDISCEQEALDAERGVISEEWRRRDDQRSRMAMYQTNLIYDGAKHTKRSVLGTLEIINGFKRDEIIDFYHKWYRPDLQALIVVGDFEVNQMESRIVRMFSDIPASVNPVPKETYDVPAITEPLFKNMLDPDVKFQTLKVIHRLPYPAPEERATEEFWKQHYTKQIITSVIAARMQKAAKQAGSPVSSAVLVTNPSVADFYTAQFTLSAKNDKLLEETLRFYSREIKRVLDHGISKDEFNVAKFHVKKRNKLNSEVYDSDITNEMIVNNCKEHFLRSRALSSPIVIHEAQQNALGSITYEEAAAYIPEMFGNSEKIYSYTINVKKEDKLPSVEKMKEIIAEVLNETLEPEYITYNKVNLDIDAPAGKIIKSKKLKNVEGELWTLSNGAKVYWLPCEKVKSANHMVMELKFDTGYRTWQQDSIAEAKAAAAYISRNIGFGNSSINDISDSPECGGIRSSFSFDRETAGIAVTTNSDEVETGFKMVQSYLCKPYFDTEKTLAKFRVDQLRNLGREISSTTKFAREQTKAKFGEHQWIDYIDSAAVAAVNMDFVRNVYDRSFGNPAEMTVFICSDLDKEMISGLVEKHLASIKGSGKIYEKSKAAEYIPIYKGEVVVDLNYPILSAPKVDVNYEFLARVKETAENNVAYQIMDYIMSQRCVSKIREERGGTYHVHFATESYGADDIRQSTIAFQTRPEIADILIKDAQDIMDDITVNGPTEEELENAVRYLIKAHGEKKQRFANTLGRRMTERRGMIEYGIPFDFDYEKVIRSISAKDIKKLAKKINNGDRLVSVYREQ